MSNNDKQQPNPITFRAKLSPLQRKNARILASSRGITIREFWEEAMEHQIAELIKCEKSGQPFQYIMVPRDAKSSPIYADQYLMEAVDSWAKRDNIQKDDAMYTALSKHIALWASKFTGLLT